MPEFLIPLHPKMVHFPVALFVTALVFELAAMMTRKNSVHQAAVYVFVFSVLATPLVVWAGLWEEERLNLRHPLAHRHEALALWTMGVGLASLPLLWLLHKKASRYFRPVFMVCLVFLAVLVGFTAHNGGRLVFEYAVGVAE